MAVKTIGRVLKERRTELGLGLSEVEQLAKIQKLYIVALEADDYKVLPGEFYIKAYLKQYAEKLGLDAEEILLAYDAGKGIMVEDSEADLQDNYHFVKPSDRVIPEEETDKTWKHYIPIISLSVVAIAIIVAVTLAVFFNNPAKPNLSQNNYQLEQSAESTSSQSSSSQSSSSQSSSTSSSTSSSSQATDTIAVTGSGQVLNVTLTTTASAVKMDFKATGAGNVWVYATNTELATTGLTINGTSAPTGSATLKTGQTSSVITLGNKDNFTLTINGQKVSLAGLTADSGPYTLNLTVQKK